MSTYKKTHTRRRRSRRKRQSRGSWLLLLVIGGIGIFIFARLYWTIFLLTTIGLGTGLLLVLIAWVTMRMRRRRGKQTEIVRDSRYIEPQLRQAVWNRCGGKCVQCESRSLLEYDHIIPLSKGGATSYGNLQVLCRTCNRHKSDHI